MMSTEEYQPAKLFSVEEANAMLPLVRAITSDLVKLAQEVVERRQRLGNLISEHDSSSSNPYDDELAQIEQELEKDAQKLNEYVEELRHLGVEPKSGTEGLIDFPTMIDGQLAYLCWKLDEPEVLHWHDLDSGFSGRQSLTASSHSGGNSTGLDAK